MIHTSSAAVLSTRLEAMEVDGLPMRPLGMLRVLPAVPYITECDRRFDAYRLTGIESEISTHVHWLNHENSLLRRNRIQLLTSCPLLLFAVAYPGTADSIGLNLICVAVDRGDRLIDALAQLVGVGRAAVRRFCRLSPAEVGRNWAARPLELMWALQLTAGYPRPGSLSEWEMHFRYWQLSGAAEESDYTTPLASNSGRGRDPLCEHVFGLLCRKGYASNVLHWLEAKSGQCLNRIVDMRDYFFFVREWCRKMGGTASSSIAELLLMRYSLAELIRQSSVWHDQIGRQVADLAECDLPMVVDSLESWPALLLEPYSCGDLQAVSLVSLQDLRHEGSTLEHCVASYDGRCLLGDCHVVSIRNWAGQSLSTVEIILTENERGIWKPRIVQNRGVSNTLPSTRCDRLALEVIDHLGLSRNQSWLAEIQRIHKERRETIELLLAEMKFSDIQADIEIMRRVLPDFDSIVSWIRTQLPPAVSLNTHC